MDERAVRSRHPTNSLIAVGPLASKILADHNEKSDPYSPYRKIIELNGKNLMLGAFNSTKLSPMAFHAAQEALGLTFKNWASGLIQIFYYDSSQIDDCIPGIVLEAALLADTNRMAITLSKMRYDSEKLVGRCLLVWIPKNRMRFLLICLKVS